MGVGGRLGIQELTKDWRGKGKERKGREWLDRAWLGALVCCVRQDEPYTIIIFFYYFIGVVYIFLVNRVFLILLVFYG